MGRTNVASLDLDVAESKQTIGLLGRYVENTIRVRRSQPKLRGQVIVWCPSGVGLTFGCDCLRITRLGRLNNTESLAKLAPNQTRR